jgi:hypothetical protein
MLPLSWYSNRWPAGFPASQAAIWPAADGDLSDPGQPVQGDHVADHEDLGMANKGQVWLDLDAPHPVQGRAALLREQLAQRAGRDAGGPHLAHRVDPAAAAGVLDLDPGAVHSHDLGSQLHLNPDPAELGQSLRAETVTERAQHRRRRIQQDHRRPARVDPGELVAQRAVRELGDLARHLHPGRPCAHDHEGHQRGALLLVLDQLCHLEAAEDAPAQLKGVVDPRARRPRAGPAPSSGRPAPRR